MSVLSWWKRVRAAYQGAVSFGPTDADAIRRVFGGPTASGKSVTEDGALAVSAAWCCVRIIAESVGMLPWAVYRRIDARNAERADDHPLAAVLVSPNADATSTEFREATTLSLCASGNAYSFVERSGERVIALTPLRSRDVTPMRKLGSNTTLPLDDGAVFFRVSDRGKPEDYPREKVWHVKGFGNDGLVGLSPLGAAREALGLALAAEEFGSAFFRQGGLPAGTVSYPGWLTKEQRVVAREALQKLVGGLGNAHQFALFEGGVKPEPWATMNLEEMQFLMLRQFSVQEVCRFFRVPPHMVADLSKATFSNIEHLSAEFVTFTLMPYLTRIEASVSKWLLSARDATRFFLRFNVDGLLRADTAARAAFYASALQNGYMSRNEVRAKENLNRVDGLDEFTAQSNLLPVEKLGEAPPAPPPPGALNLLSGADAAALVEQLGTALDALARQEREITVGGETFRSKPVLAKPH